MRLDLPHHAARRAAGAGAHASAGAGAHASAHARTCRSVGAHASAHAGAGVVVPVVVVAVVPSGLQKCTTPVLVSVDIHA